MTESPGAGEVRGPRVRLLVGMLMGSDVASILPLCGMQVLGQVFASNLAALPTAPRSPLPPPPISIQIPSSNPRPRGRSTADYTQKCKEQTLHSATSVPYINSNGSERRRTLEAPELLRSQDPQRARYLQHCDKPEVS